MDLLLVTFGTAGDVHPFLGLSRALKARGHAVTLISNARFAALARREKIDFAGLPDPKTLAPPPSIRRRSPLAVMGRLARLALTPFIRGWSKTARVSTLAPLIRPVYQAIVERLVPGRSVLVASAPALGARLASEYLGVPLATVHLSPALVRSVERPPITLGFGLARFVPRWFRRTAYRLLDGLGIDPRLAGPINRFREELGLAPVRSILGSWRDSPNLILGLYPDWFGEPQIDWPTQMRLTGFPLYDDRSAETPTDLTTFLDAGPPPILFTASSALRDAHDFFRQSVEACRQRGRRGLLVTPFAEQVPSPLPKFIHHTAYVPFGNVLPRVAALVHHGGIGTASQALAAGVPQLIVPQRNDQPDNAERLTRLGAARTMAPGAYHGRTIAAALGAMERDEAMHRVCRELARRIKESRSIDDTCCILEAWASPRLEGRAAA